MGRHFHTAPSLHRTDEFRTDVYPKTPESGAWWYVRPTPPGQRKPGKRIPLGFVAKTTKREADKNRLKELARINRLPIAAATQTTFEQFADLYEREFVAHKAPSTQRTYRRTIKNVLLPRFGELRLCDITGLHVQRWVTSMAAVPFKGRRSRLSVLRSMFEWAIRMSYYAEANPATYTELGPEPIRAEDPVAYTPDQVAALLARLPEPKRTVAEVMFFTGLRSCEALGLTPKALLEDGRLFIFQSFDRCARVLVPATKNKKSNIVACPSPLMAKLRAIAADCAPGERLWDLTYQTLYRALKKAETATGLDTYRSGTHTARRSFVTQFEERTGALPVDQLGHSSAKVTEIYLRPPPERQADQVERLWMEVWGGAAKGGVQ
ncbi:MAG: tyrosine-type recombinase/integrase [bacterium]|nr:tyrosine-type recombinase/integrase [bacterium]